MKTLIHCIHCGSANCRLTSEDESTNQKVLECQECFWSFRVDERDWRERFKRQSHRNLRMIG